jgi:Domain of unknown function (DUF4845)
MPLPERGEGFFKTIIFLAFVSALVFAAVKLFPVYFNNYQISDYIRDRAVQAAVNRTSTDVVQTEVVRYAHSLGVDLTGDDVQVTNEEGTVRIRIDYTVPVDFKIAIWNVHFTPSAESRAL